MSIQFTNDATTFLASNINASVTTITVVDASSFPTLASGDHTYITLSTPTNSTKEIVKCTAIVGNTLTVIRAQEGTTATSFTTEDRAQIRITAQLFRDIMLAYSSLNSYRYTATAGQTTFTGTDIHSATLAYLPNNIIVMLNGVGMGTVDYTATDGSSIVFNVGATLNDEITIVAFTAFGVSDHYKKSETDALLAGKVDDSQVLTNVPSGALFTDTNTVYTHPTNHAISVITGLQAALDDKVDDSQVLTNVPSGALFTDTNTVYTHPSNHAISVITGLQAALDGKTTESYVNTAVSNLVDSSPAALNTLNELAAALGDDANFSTTTATALGLRVAKDSATGAASMPTGTTAQRPTGALGMFRHNTTLNQFEGYNDGAWGALAGGGEVSFVTYEYIATAGQTTFSGADSNNLTLAYTVANIIVSYGGQDLPHSDYTATNGTSVVLDDGAVVGEIVRIVAFTTFTVADTYTQAQIDSKDATKLPLAGGTMTGALFIASPNQATGGNALQIRQGNNTAYGIDMGLSQTNGHLNISKVNNGTSTHMMTLARDTGNVGIGTTAPLGQLQVGGSTTVSADSKIIFGKSTVSSQGYLPVIQHSSTGGVGNDLVLAATSTDGAIRMYTGASSGSGISQTGNNAERMRINADGIVTKPYQPAFLAQGANGQNNIAVGSTSTILLPSERFDNNNDFSSNTFTAPVTGKYQLNSHVYLLQMPTNSSYFETYLVTSNRTYAGAITPSSYGGGGISYVSIEIAVLADMDAGDTAFLRISQGSGTQSTDVHQNTSFSGYLVC